MQSYEKHNHNNANIYTTPNSIPTILDMGASFNNEKKF